MYSITITITCNHKNQRLQITFRLLKTCNRLHVITITDYNYNRSAAQGLQDIHFVNHLVVQTAFANQWFKMMQFGGFTNDF